MQPTSRILILIASYMVLVSQVSAQETSLQESDNNSLFSSVAELLQSKCLGCHNVIDPKGDFSLQSKSDLLDSGYIDLDAPSESHLLEVVTTDETSLRMPKDGSPLRREEIDLLRNWLEAGAKWPAETELQEPVIDDFDWWSYKPLLPVSVPKQGWGRNEIDAFVADKHLTMKLTPALEADRRTLIRRVTYDLTGLPPTPAEVDSFVSDERKEAYAELVERLLASDRYGERWARHWLDVVKYADTCGYDKDKLRNNAWPYRDYVIRSFNDDKPYGRFIEEQIAGDVLFPGQPDGILGLGFIAAGPWDFIGHVEVPESKLDGKVARNLDRDDMVSNAINTFCSLTVQCARCHHHKFDPITQQDYYGLHAIFAGVDRAERPYDQSPEVEAKRRALTANLKRCRDELKSVDQEIATAGGTELERLKELVADLEGKQKVQKNPAFGYHSQISEKAGTEKWIAVKLSVPGVIERIVLRPCHDDFAGIGAGFCFPVRFRLEVSTDGEDWKTVAEETREDVANPGLRPYEAEFSPRRAQWIRLTATKLRERRKDYALAIAEIQVFATAEPSPANDSVSLAIAGAKAKDSIEAAPRWGKANVHDGHFAKSADPQAAQDLASASEALETLLGTIETPKRMERRAKLSKQIKALEGQLAKLPIGKMVYAAATHFKPQGNFKPMEGKLREVAILHRGNVDQPLGAAQPGFLRISDSHTQPKLGALTEGERRGELAKWLSSRENPFVWRSIVNRVWLYHFGRGLVDTPNDFGRMGAKPTHPELLDWLAMRFRDGDQSIKDLHRLILMSDTYRQSSDFNDENASIDSSNQYYWRMNRRRLSAEEIRDSILAVSGSLQLEMGGPGFYLFKLEKTTHSPHYEYHKFDPAERSTHRRSIYRFIVRSQPDPWMTTLDCADSSQSTPKRNETLTSLQALSLLNNQFNLVMAERFAKSLESQFASHNDRVAAAFQLVCQREATELELRVLSKYATEHGMSNLCRYLFNFSEFVFLD